MLNEMYVVSGSFTTIVILSLLLINFLNERKMAIIFSEVTRKYRKIILCVILEFFRLYINIIFYIIHANEMELETI